MILRGKNEKASCSYTLRSILMKKLLLTIFSVLFCGASYTLPLMNPKEASLLCDGVFWKDHCATKSAPCLIWPDEFSIRFGFYGDYIFNRQLQTDTSSKTAMQGSEIYTNAAYIAVNLWDRFDLWGTLGETSIQLTGDGTPFNVLGQGERFTLSTENKFSYSIGLRGTIWECGDTFFGAEFQWFQGCPAVSYMTSNEQNTVHLNNVTTNYTDWQIGLGVSHQINLLVPYIGLKWGTARMKFGNASVDINGTNYRLFNLQSSKVWGYAVGTSLIDCEEMSLTVEADFGNEIAMFANGQFRF